MALNSISVLKLPLNTNQPTECGWIKGEFLFIVQLTTLLILTAFTAVFIFIAMEFSDVNA